MCFMLSVHRLLHFAAAKKGDAPIENESPQVAAVFVQGYFMTRVVKLNCFFPAFNQMGEMET